jgi:hypothetical protein
MRYPEKRRVEALLQLGGLLCRVACQIEHRTYGPAVNGLSVHHGEIGRRWCAQCKTPFDPPDAERVGDVVSTSFRRRNDERAERMLIQENDNISNNFCIGYG